jgi:hypothetical protein
MRPESSSWNGISLALAALVALAAAVRPLIGQEPRAPGPPGPGRATHLVQPGETLWSLAMQYFGDPLLWQEIYRLNTDVIEDPRWIFPGEELRLVADAEGPTGPRAAPGEGAVVVTPAGSDTPPGRVARPRAQAARPRQATPADSVTIFETVGRRPQEASVSLDLRLEQAYRAVREGEYYASGFLTEDEPLVAGAIVAAATAQSIRRLSGRGTVSLYDEVVVSPPGGESYARGDLLLVYQRGRRVRGYGDVIVPTGLLVVRSPGGDGGAVNAVVRALYRRVEIGQPLIKVARFAAPPATRADPVDSGVVGAVVARRDLAEIASAQDVIFISVGAEDGVHLGDVFQITSVPGAGLGEAAVAQEQGKLLIVHTRPRTATGIVVELAQADIRPGAIARQIRRMPS